MTLQQLTYLVTVAECGNITDAAERLVFSPPSGCFSRSRV